MTTTKVGPKGKKLPYFHAFSYGNSQAQPEAECPECRADILKGERDSNGRLLSLSKPSGELVVK